MLQAVYLFKPLLWLLFAGGVYIIWSGSLMIASASLLDRRLERLVVGRPRAHVSDAPHSDGASLVGSLRRQFIVGTRETARPG